MDTQTFPIYVCNFELMCLCAGHWSRLEVLVRNRQEEVAAKRNTLEMVALGMPTTVKKDLGGDWACHLQEMFPHSGIASRLYAFF